MSYSRWSKSIWYTYNSSGLDNLIRDEQIFTICAVAAFTYKELKTDIEACLKEAAYCQQKIYPPVKTDDGDIEFGIDTTAEPVIDPTLYPTPEEIEELRGYMLRFINDVENDKELK